MKFLTLTMRNFLSIGNCTQSIRLDSNSLTLVLGNNIDLATNNSNNKNGVGKTSLLQAISYVLFDEPLTKIKMDNLINSINQKGMLVTLEFEVESNTYRIERGRKPNILNFYKNNKAIGEKDENDALGEKKLTQEDINNLIGMDHTLFCHIVAMNTYTTPFLREKPPQQREIIEKLLGITKLSERDKKLTEIIKETKRLIRDEEITIKAISDANDRITLAIENAEKESNTWEEATSLTIENLQTRINKYDQINFEKELQLFDAIEAHEKELESLSLLIKEEQKETTLLKRERERFVNAKNDLAKELLRTTDTQIERLKNEAKRCDIEAEKGCENEVAKLKAEIVRCEKEALKTCDAEIARLKIQAERRMEDAAKKSAAADEKMVQLAKILAEIENSDGHSCTTCGQNIDGTDHLQNILANLTLKAEKLEKELEKDLEASSKLENEATEILAEINVVKENHINIQQNWLLEIEKLQENILRVEENQIEVKNEWIKKADSIRLEIFNAEKALEEKKSSIQENIKEVEQEIESFDLRIGVREADEEKYIVSLQELAKNAPKNSLYDTRDDLWKDRDRYNNLLKDMEIEKNKQNPHQSTILTLKSTLQNIDCTALNNYQDDLKHQDFIHKLLTTKDSFIRKKIIDQNLYLLNSKLSKYLRSLGLPHEVSFKQDLTVEITHMARDFDFEQLSRGEMNRVILAVSWSFRDIWEELNNNINLLLVDEMADSGMDGAGIEATLEILMKMALKRSVFLISHKEELIGRVDKILMVHKEENFTRFEMQE